MRTDSHTIAGGWQSRAGVSALLAAGGQFRKQLRDWYQASFRQLPWRLKPSPYATTVSEFMLQQTQVATVLPYFERWMGAFPDFAALAAAPEDRVLKLWEGLGYYSRARNLHALARGIAALPELPRTAEGWLAFTGVGPYTAAAISSIAFNYPAAVVDGNVVRILARLTGDATLFRDSAAAVKVFMPVAQGLLDHTDPGTHNQAMMELGATICVRPQPLCTVCPVYAVCAAGRRGDAAQLPRFQPREITQRTVDRLWIWQEGRFLLHRLPADSGRLANCHELPDATLLGVTPQGIPRLIRNRAIGNTRFREQIFTLAPDNSLLRKIKKREDCCWVTPGEALDELVLSGPHRRWLQELLEDHPFFMQPPEAELIF